MSYLLRTTAKKPTLLILVVVLSLPLFWFSSFFMSDFKVMAQEDITQEASTTPIDTTPADNTSQDTTNTETTSTENTDNQEADSQVTDENTETEATEQEANSNISTSTEETIIPDESIINQDTEDPLNTENASSTSVLDESETGDISTTSPETINLEDQTSQTSEATPENPEEVNPVAETGQTTSFSVGGTSSSAVSGGYTPQIIASWQMNNNQDENNEYLGTDDEADELAQFLPSGLFEVDKNIVICAVATDPDDMADINSVKANIYYPEDIAWGQDDTANSCQIRLAEEMSLEAVNSSEAQELLCNTIKNNNNNLPVFNGSMSYDTLCEADGSLAEQTAQAYCVELPLSYNSPAGMYKLEIFALDKDGMAGDMLTSAFEYLPLTSYEVDFSSVYYGAVGLDIQKIIHGNPIFSLSDGQPTIRNVGNTRLQMGIIQDDMGLGEANIRYAAKVGQNEDDWQDYLPNTDLTDLRAILDLSQTEPMDFSILVTDFPEETTPWGGGMNLFAKFIDFLQCPLID